MFRFTANGKFIVRENFSQYTELSLDEFRQKRTEKKIRLSTKPITLILKNVLLGILIKHVKLMNLDLENVI